jgi:hypothetical protein
MPDNQPVASSHSDNSDFFVGYLPTPAGARHLLLWFSVFACLALVVVSGILAAGQRDPGTGRWETAVSRTFDGLLISKPYPVLRMFDPAHPNIKRTFLLVSEGKFGVESRARKWESKPVRVTGTILDRDGRSLLELADDADAIQPAQISDEQLATLSSWPSLDSGRVTLRGEIIDPKCYIGAMKPGGGKTHKACAQLCLSGGIPPMLVTRNPAGEETYYLLAGPAGGPMQRVVLPYVGDPVQVAGTLRRLGDLFIISVDPSGVVRL